MHSLSLLPVKCRSLPACKHSKQSQQAISASNYVLANTCPANTCPLLLICHLKPYLTIVFDTFPGILVSEYSPCPRIHRTPNPALSTLTIFTHLFDRSGMASQPPPVSSNLTAFATLERGTRILVEFSSRCHWRGID